MPTSLAFSPDGKLCACPGWESISLLDASTGQQIRRFEGLKAHVHAAAFSPDNKFLAANSVPFLEGRLHPAPAPDLRQLTNLIGDLKSDRFEKPKTLPGNWKTWWTWPNLCCAEP
jgi:WD40 repeat protein